jgi:hypothetical protein
VLGENPLLRRILEAGEAYRVGAISIEELRARVNGNMSALEGDVPKAIREAAFVLEANIDLVRFTVEKSSQQETIAQLIDNFAALISAEPSDIANPS